MLWLIFFTRSHVIISSLRTIEQTKEMTPYPSEQMVKMKSFLISDGTAKYLSYLKITFAESVHSMKILTGLVHTTEYFP